jgi:hypothetical protein
VYDMYSWDPPASSADEHAEARATQRGPRRTADDSQVARASHADPPDHARRAAQAVQVALDRRDNGGDAGSGRKS